MKVKLTYLGNPTADDMSDCVVGLPGSSTVFPVGELVEIDTSDPDYRGAPEGWLKPLLTNRFFKVELDEPVVKRGPGRPPNPVV